MKKKKYYLGLDIGTDSIGFAATDTEYNLLRFNGSQVWGSHLFDEAQLNTERRGFRTARRRLDRRQQRVVFVQELFEAEISKSDPGFYQRLRGSYLFRADADSPYTLFNDPDYTDKDHYGRYPTIHHLIVELMRNPAEHDVRLVYLACAWLVAHRGHFLSNISKDNISDVKNFDKVYDDFASFFISNDYALPFETDQPQIIGDILKQKAGVTKKQKDLTALLFDGKKPPKEGREDFPYSTDAIIKLLSDGTVKLKDLFCNDEYAEAGSVCLKSDDDKLAEVMTKIGDDFDLITTLRSLTDWAVLVETLGDSDTVSEAKVKVYEQHSFDLKALKYIIRKYKNDKYDDVFRKDGKDNYTAYSAHDSSQKKSKKEDFSKYIAGILKTISPDEADRELLSDMLTRLELLTFMPKQKDTDNRVIPHQLYWYELKTILENAAGYLPFLNETDEYGLSVSEKILSVFSFRIPYFVGPLNKNSSFAWLERKEGKIYPWNFEKMVDLDKSEEKFIRRMTNYCTYLPGESVLPKDSILYRRFTVLNELNNLKINGEPISVELKQGIYRDLFENFRKVSVKKLTDYLKRNGILKEGDELSGIDTGIKGSLSSYIDFKRLISSGTLTEDDAERIIERAAYAENKTRLSKWLRREYPHLSEEDIKNISGIRVKDFGRLSRCFLAEMEGCSVADGVVYTIIGAMWETNNNLMELLSKKYTFMDAVESFRRDYYSENPVTLEEKMDEMYLSNAVKRSVYRTLDVVGDIRKAFGSPAKIFVETTRSADDSLKGKRTKSRKEQILEYYRACAESDVRELRKQLEEMGERADSSLRSDKLFLYYMQLGKCAYSGVPIEMKDVGSKYDIDHIYPRAYVKDDSIINNKVLVLKEINGAKGEDYPLPVDIQSKMSGFWHSLNKAGLMSDEKLKRLVRVTPFSADEKLGFINRQLTETSQATKAVAAILHDTFPETEIVYSKAGLVSDFRHEFDCLKSRTFNDLHHASDAYLNIVVGNVYHMKFTGKWFSPERRYSIKTESIFKGKKPLVIDGQTVWDTEKMLPRVKETANKNTAKITVYSYFKTGKLFNQPVRAKEGLIPLKENLNLPTEKYGGYDNAGIMFFIPVKFRSGEKTDVIIMPVEILYGRKFIEDAGFAQTHTSKRLGKILGMPVTDVSFPMGMRPWKVNTVLSLDGFRICLSGTQNTYSFF